MNYCGISFLYLCFSLFFSVFHVFWPFWPARPLGDAPAALCGCPRPLWPCAGLVGGGLVALRGLVALCGPCRRPPLVGLPPLPPMPRPLGDKMPARRAPLAAGFRYTARAPRGIYGSRARFRKGDRCRPRGCLAAPRGKMYLFGIRGYFTRAPPRPRPKSWQALSLHAPAKPPYYKAFSHPIIFRYASCCGIRARLCLMYCRYGVKIFL